MKTLAIAISMLGICSCQQKLNKIKTFENIELPTTTKEMVPYLDSLYQNDKIKLLPLSNGSKIVCYPSSFSGKKYYAGISPIITNHITIGMKLHFIDEFQYNFIQSQPIEDATVGYLDQLVWFSNPNNSVINHQLGEQFVKDLSLKYGTPLANQYDSVVVASNGVRDNLSIVENSWQKKDLNIRLVISNQIGSGNLKINLYYILSDGYLKENSKLIEELKKQQVTF
ncbi:MAG: hypothetical protein EOP04_00525 [Proteobacteria bacterium]|nr:MAG: hypothetical protein EOP04_00525 [Pseudomonadota bacterium]